MVKTKNHLNPTHHGNPQVLDYIKIKLFSPRKYTNKISIEQFNDNIIWKKNYIILSSK